ncbi:hypothetical protein Tco_0446512, partial [Tanacetum coccineum]
MKYSNSPSIRPPSLPATAIASSCKQADFAVERLQLLATGLKQRQHMLLRPTPRPLLGLNMESVFHISNCAVENQVKFATCTFLGNALTWWNSHMKTVTQDVAYAMEWKALKKMMTLVLMCRRMSHEKSEEVEKYVVGLPDMIRGNVMSYQPKTMEKAIEFANDHTDQKVLTIIERQAEHKRKLEFNAKTIRGTN